MTSKTEMSGDDWAAVNALFNLLDTLFCVHHGGGYINAKTTEIRCAHCGNVAEHSAWFQWGGAPFMCDVCGAGWVMSDKTAHWREMTPEDAVARIKAKMEVKP